MTLLRFFITLFFFISVHVFAQTSPGNRDSLLQTLETLPRDTNRVNSLWKLGKIATANQVYDSAIYYGRQAVELATELKFERGIANTNIDLGVAYFFIGNYSEALNCNYAALEIFQRLGDLKGVSQANNNMGIAYARQKNFDKALECYRITLGIKKSLGDTKATASTLINMGSAYDNLKKYDSAFICYREGLAVKRSMDDQRGVATCLMNLGLLHSKVLNPDSCNYYLTQSLELRRAIPDKRGIVSSLTSLGALRITLKQYPEAETFLLEADTLSQALGTLDLSQQIWEELTKLYDSTGRYKDALHAHRIYTELTDSLNLAEANRNSDKLEMNYEFEKERIAMQADKDTQAAVAAEADKRRLTWIIGITIVLVLVILFSISLFTRLRIIRGQKSIIEQQKLLVEAKSKEVYDSINYAKRIQYTLLAHESFLASHLKEHFIFFQPKDIVSGDFYWASAQGEKFYVAVCDSTGHGVPGAFMSLLNISFLNEAIAERKMTEPSLILDFVREKLIQNISQDGNMDGMDAVLMCIDKKKRTVTYAGANNSPVIVGSTGTTDCDADKMPVGLGATKQPFSQHTLQLNEGDALYVFTDGFYDQFGGDKGKKYKRSQLLEKLASITSSDMITQRETLSAEFSGWKGELEQIDDVLVVGIRF
jgi:serine phosphatase RsbU (regulator of sigma subunit)/Tfp pilus assembly protein PilF